MVINMSAYLVVASHTRHGSYDLQIPGEVTWLTSCHVVQVLGSFRAAISFFRSGVAAAAPARGPKSLTQTNSIDS